MSVSIVPMLFGAVLVALLAVLPLVTLLRESRRTRKALAEQQSILESAFRGAASGMLLLDLEGRITKVNQAVCELLGYAKPELIGKSFREITYADDLEDSVATFERLVAGALASYQIQKRYVHRSGHAMWGLVSNALVRDDHGQPRFCVAQIQELTESKREAEALAERERQLTQAGQLAKLAGWEWDLETNVIRWSDSLFEALGLCPAEVEPGVDSYLGFVHPDDRLLLLESLAKVKSEHRSFAIDQRIVLRSGEQRIFHVQGRADVDPNGKAISLHGSVQDVTESRRALDLLVREAEAYREVIETLGRRNAEIERQITERDADLKARDEMLRRIVDNVPAAIAYFDRNLTCQWVSPTAQRYMGITGGDVSRVSAANLPVFGNFAGRMAEVMAAGKPYHAANVPVRGVRGGGPELTYWDYSLIPYMDSDGEATGILAFGLEVSDRIEKLRLQEAQIETLAASEALKDHFLSTLSHEIRSPLTVILGTASLLEGEVLGPVTVKQRQFIAKLLRNGRELSRLVNNVIEANLLRSGRLELHVEPVAMEAVIREVTAEVEAAAGLKNQHLVIEVETGLPLLVGDRRRLYQIGLNLVSNAVQYAPEGAVITLRARREGDRLRFEVFNPGSRIPGDTLDDLYTALERPLPSQKGLGLGLGLSKALAEAHGGSLEVLSHDEGVTAVFSLPLAIAVPESR